MIAELESLLGAAKIAATKNLKRVCGVKFENNLIMIINCRSGVFLESWHYRIEDKQGRQWWSDDGDIMKAVKAAGIHYEKFHDHFDEVIDDIIKSGWKIKEMAE